MALKTNKKVVIKLLALGTLGKLNGYSTSSQCRPGCTLQSIHTLSSVSSLTRQPDVLGQRALI